jgi:hypothetical protein
MGAMPRIRPYHGREVGISLSELGLFQTVDDRAQPPKLEQAAIAHGGWNMKLHGPLEIERGELVEHQNSGFEVSKRFLAWLDTLKGPEYDDMVFAEDTLLRKYDWPVLEQP